MMELAGFFLSRSKWNRTDFGQSRSTVRSLLSYKIEDTGGAYEDKISFRCSCFALTTPRCFIFLREAVCHGFPINQKQRRKGETSMTLYEYYDRKIPDYYDTMYRDGYSPEQILHSARRKILREYEARKAERLAETEAMEIPEVKITSEVRIK